MAAVTHVQGASAVKLAKYENNKGNTPLVDQLGTTSAIPRTDPFTAFTANEVEVNREISVKRANG